MEEEPNPIGDPAEDQMGGAGKKQADHFERHDWWDQIGATFGRGDAGHDRAQPYRRHGGQCGDREKHKRETAPTGLAEFHNVLITQ